MIGRRRASKYTQNVESLQQSSFTSLRGIDCSKAPTNNDTVLNVKNLDVDYDGGLVLRKPITFANSFDTNTAKVHYAYDGSLLNYRQGFLRKNNYAVYSYKFTDIFGVSKKYVFYGKLSAFGINFENAKFINTSSSTLIYNVIVNLKTILEKTGYQVYNPNVESEEQLRMFKWDSESNSLEMITPEINTLSSDTIAVDFNTTLDNPLAIRDNYNAAATAVKGILAYSNVASNPVTQSVHLEYTYKLSDPLGENIYKEYVVTTEDIYTKGSVFSVSVKFPQNTGTEHPQDVVLTLSVNDQSVFNKFIITLIVGSISKTFTVTDFSDTVVFNMLQTEFGTTPVVGGTSYILDITYYADSLKVLDTVYLDNLTESKNYHVINTVSRDIKDYIILKAFLDKPYNVDSENTVLKWEYSDDGVTWVNEISADPTRDSIKVAYLSETLNTDLENSLKLDVEHYYPLNLPLYQNIDSVSVPRRPDCLILKLDSNIVDRSYRCTVAKLKSIPDTIEAPQGVTKMIDYIMGSQTYFFSKSTFEILTQDFKNPTQGDMIYWNHALYSISPEFKNNVYVSNPDSAIFPVSRIIDLGTYQGTTISKLIPWRDYLVAFTENSVHLITEQEVGFTTKTVNTFIGVPERDANTCVSILNGIIFKSGNKLYTLIPNYNSGDESILNISDISKPIEHILENLTYNEKYKPFAFTTSESYYLFVPDAVDTKCLKYNYSRKIWTFYTYPRVFYDYKIMSVDDIRLFSKVDGVIYEYYFEKEPSDIIDLQMYGDYIDLEKDSDNAYKVVPIEFFVDSGQKTDNIVLTKQFVESKIIVATLSDKDNFQMDVNIAVEGNTFKKHIDLNTDGALLRNDPNQLLTLGSSADSANSDTFNTIRQMFIRYSGKGKTIRHIISGTSLYKFKIYETLYRYKILNVKQ